MLQKKITYSDDFPIVIRMATVKNVPLHYHTDIELVYVMEGEIALTSGYCNYTLKSGDIFVNNGNEIHSLSSEDRDNLVAIIQISNSFFTKYFPTLGKSFYRTYSNKGERPRLDELRRMLLSIILHYQVRSLNYKNQCIYETIDLIRYLYTYFNLFTIDEKMVISLSEENPIILERLSRIIGFLYDNYQSKVTLEDISKEEHLSIYYLSHLIKDYTGMSFRDFLSFVRVERSEIELLGSNKKISQIAKNVGFSTTAYYRKFFEQWYGHSPEKHRELNITKVISPHNQEVMEDYPLSKSINLTKSLMYGINSEAAAGLVTREERDIYVSAQAEPIGKLPSKIMTFVSKEDRQFLGDSLGSILELLSAETINTSYPLPSDTPIYGWDTIAGALSVVQGPFGEDSLRVPLRDQGDSFPFLKGCNALLFSNGVRKPIYYSYLFLSLARGGDIISRGDNHMVVRKESDSFPTCYYVLGFNHDARIDKLCMMSSSVYETADLIEDFRDRLDLTVNLKVPSRKYAMIRYSLNEENNLFHYLSALGFPGQNEGTTNNAGFKSVSKYVSLLNIGPQSSIATLDAKDSGGVISVNFTIEGAGLELAILSSE